jgi:hypothetical protein
LQLNAETRLLARDGHTIQVDAPVTGNTEAIAAWIVGPATTAILYQRNLVPLHASAVEINGGAVAFLAPSGTGKSSLAAALLAQGTGARLVTDDVLAVETTADGTLQVWPGSQGIRLDQWARTAVAERRFTLVREMADGKSLLAPDAGIADTPMPLRALFTLSLGESLSVRRLEGLELLSSLRQLLQRPALSRLLGSEAVIFHTLTRVMDQVPAFQVTRPYEGWTLDHTRDLVHRCLADVPALFSTGAGPHA